MAALAPVLWGTHLAVMYALVPLSCRVGTDAPLHLATLVAAAGLVLSVVVAVRFSPEGCLRGFVGALLDRSPGRDRHALPLVALAMSVYFLGVVVMTGVTPLVVDRCA